MISNIFNFNIENVTEQWRIIQREKSVKTLQMVDVPDKATSKKKLPSSELFLFLSNVVCRLIYNLIIRV